MHVKCCDSENCSVNCTLESLFVFNFLNCPGTFEIFCCLHHWPFCNYNVNSICRVFIMLALLHTLHNQGWSFEKNCCAKCMPCRLSRIDESYFGSNCEETQNWFIGQKFTFVKKTLLYRFCDSVKLTASLLVLFQFLFVQRNRKSLLVFNFLSDEVKFGARMAEMLKSPVKRKGQYGRP